MNFPKVSIIIPTRNEERYIAKNVDSILTQNYKGEIEIIVVDGMSEDNTRFILSNYKKKYPSIKVLDNPKKFTPEALNIGIDNSTGIFFIILGGHAFLEEDFVENNIELMNKNAEIGCTGGVINNIFENKEGELIAKAMSSVFGVGNATFRTGGKAGFVDTVAFGAYRKSVYDEIGGFDEDLIRNQDDEYNFRLLKAGYKIYFDPKVISNYYVRGSFSKLKKQYFQYGYWKVYVNKKHGKVTTIRQLFPALLILGFCFGFILSFLWIGFLYLTSIATLIYLLTGLFFAKKASNRSNEVFPIFKTFLILHFSYGTGYLKGIFDFLILNKKPTLKSQGLTR